MGGGKDEVLAYQAAATFVLDSTCLSLEAYGCLWKQIRRVWVRPSTVARSFVRTICGYSPGLASIRPSNSASLASAATAVSLGKMRSTYSEYSWGQTRAITHGRTGRITYSAHRCGVACFFYFWSPLGAVERAGLALEAGCAAWALPGARSPHGQTESRLCETASFPLAGLTQHPGRVCRGQQVRESLIFWEGKLGLAVVEGVVGSGSEWRSSSRERKLISSTDTQYDSSRRLFERAECREQTKAFRVR